MAKLRNLRKAKALAIMSVTVNNNSSPTPIQALDPHLSLIASQAAIELDNLRLGTATDFEAVTKLASRLKDSMGEIPGSGRTKGLMDPQAIHILSQAYTEAEGETIKTVDELAHKALLLADGLGDAKESSAKDQIEKLRDFCIALSRIASSYRKSVMSQRKPDPPFRRG